MAIFLLPFEGNYFFQGIVKNVALPFKKDFAYDFLNKILITIGSSLCK